MLPALSSWLRSVFRYRGLNVDSRDIFFFQLIGYSARALVVLAAAGLIDSVRATAAVVTLILGACANAASLLGLVDPGFGFWPRFWDFAELLFQPWCLATTAGVLVWVGSHPQDDPTAHGETQPA